MISIKACTLSDLHALQTISCKTFQDTYASTNTEANIKAYLVRAFNLDTLRNELLNNASQFYFIYQVNRLAGYIKLNEGPAQTDINDPASLELERIYILNDFQGKGLGRYLMEKAIEIAQNQKKSYVWLGVWDQNEKAIAFYKKSHFYPIGTHTFVIGDEVQNDYLMRKDIQEHKEAVRDEGFS